VAVADLDAARVKGLETSKSGAVRERAAPIIASLNLARRQDVVDAYRPALALPGDAARGKAAFRKVCASCHRLEGAGHEIGPNLASMRNRGAEAILLNVLDPNREVNPQYVNYLVALADGRTLSGLITAETASSLTLARAENATDTVLRRDVEELRSTGMSIMPEGIEKQVDQQTMADLIGYILSAK
jgi:putative heme-binding domain-containing protein